MNEKSKITLVTMLYDIASKDLQYNKQIIGDYRRKTIDDYLKFGEYLFYLDANLIIFLETSELNDKVHELCQKHNKMNVVMIVKPFETFSNYNYINVIKRCDELNPIEGRSIIKDTNYYRICVWEKFELLKQALITNPFKTEYFGWIDFGLSYRATIPPNINEIIEQPTEKVKLSLLAPLDNKIADTPYNYYSRQSSRLDAGYFSGNKLYMNSFILCFQSELINCLEFKQVAPMEETIMFKLVSQNPRKYVISWPIYYSELFKKLLT